MLLTTELPASGGEMTDATWEDCLVNEVTAPEAPATRGGSSSSPRSLRDSVAQSLCCDAWLLVVTGAGKSADCPLSPGATCRTGDFVSVTFGLPMRVAVPTPDNRVTMPVGSLGMCCGVCLV